MLESTDNSRYEGEFHNDLYHGRGTLQYSDGSKYEGEWVDGKPQGKGVFTAVDGSRHEGQLRNDAMLTGGQAEKILQPSSSATVPEAE